MPVINGKVVRSRYTSLRLSELSAIDNPAQPGALATIMKRETQITQSVDEFLAAVRKISPDDLSH